MNRMFTTRWTLYMWLVARTAVGMADRPNVLLVFTDDWGWADLGAHRVNEEVRTPNLDRLAADGVVCTRGYVTAPQCTPSRAGLLTGMYQQRWGVEQNGIRLPLEAVTIAERLQQIGYATGMSGKWHLEVEHGVNDGRPHRSISVEHWPHRQGFEEYFCGVMFDYVASHALDGTPLLDAPRQVRVLGQCRVVTQTEAALSFLRRRAAEQPARPWFLYVAYMAPHVPLESPEPWFSATPTNLPHERRQALALMAAVDDGIGRLREQIRAMGAETNTLIFFSSDNGAPLGRNWNGSLNAPMRGEKGMLGEGGIRVPFLLAWPSRIPAGQRFEHPVSCLDVAATVLAAAGLSRPPELDGTNLLPFLTGTVMGPPHETLYWRWRSQAAVLEFPWKLIVLGNGERLLFDITTPEGESDRRNQLREYPEIAARLAAKLEVWCRSLQPPGLPISIDYHHESLFIEHGLLSSERQAVARPATTPAGWFARNGQIVFTNGALTIKPAGRSSGRVVLIHPDLDLVGPLTATLVVRARRGGHAAISWRTNTERDFQPKNTVEFDWPATDQWTPVQIELSLQGRLRHLRLIWPRGEGIEVRSIELRPRVGEPQVWRFDE